MALNLKFSIVAQNQYTVYEAREACLLPKGIQAIMKINNGANHIRHT